MKKLYWIALFCLTFELVAPLQTLSVSKVPHNVIRRLGKYLKDRARRYQSASSLVNELRRTKGLRAEPILPGHTLIRPSKQTLNSAVQYPSKDKDSAVYGNLNNLGITYDKTNSRIRYSNFRKHNDLASMFLDVKKNKKQKIKTRPMIVIELDPSELSNIIGGVSEEITNQDLYENTDSTEILDDLAALFQKGRPDWRRKSSAKSRFRKHKKNYERDSDKTSASSESEELEKNPGNPYTIYKNKYRQNWLWNHVMDGDHMNVNPLAPQLSAGLGPSGAELFFGRKWWYFNQDDFRPFR